MMLKMTLPTNSNDKKCKTCGGLSFYGNSDTCRHCISYKRETKKKGKPFKIKLPSSIYRKTFLNQIKYQNIWDGKK